MYNRLPENYLIRFYVSKLRYIHIGFYNLDETFDHTAVLTVDLIFINFSMLLFLTLSLTINKSIILNDTRILIGNIFILFVSCTIS